MAATQDSKYKLGNWIYEIEEYNLSALNAGQLETITHTGPSGLAPFKVEVMTTTRATSGSPLSWSWEASDTSNNTISVRFDTETGGDLTGAVVKVLLYWREFAAQDGTSISAS